jgi:hypothetical protein
VTRPLACFLNVAMSLRSKPDSIGEQRFESSSNLGLRVLTYFALSQLDLLEVQLAPQARRTGEGEQASPPWRWRLTRYLLPHAPVRILLPHAPIRKAIVDQA